MLTPEERRDILEMNRQKYPILVYKFKCKCGRVGIGRWAQPGGYVMDEPGWLYAMGHICPDCAKKFWRDYEARCKETGCTPLNQL